MARIVKGGGGEAAVRLAAPRGAWSEAVPIWMSINRIGDQEVDTEERPAMEYGVRIVSITQKLNTTAINKLSSRWEVDGYLERAVGGLELAVPRSNL